MIRSVVTTLLVAAAFVGGAMATVQLNRYCEASGSPWHPDELARCMSASPPEYAQADAVAEPRASEPRVARGASRAVAEVPDLDQIPVPAPDIVTALPLPAYHPPDPILLQRDGPTRNHREGYAEPRELVHATASVPRTTVPTPRDDAEVRRLLAHHYPTSLATAGTGGMVVLSLMISPEGQAGAPEVVSGSGVDALDAAALEVARRVRFTPAVQQGRRVEARILFPVVFQPS